MLAEPARLRNDTLPLSLSHVCLARPSSPRGRWPCGASWRSDWLSFTIAPTLPKAGWSNEAVRTGLIFELAIKARPARITIAMGCWIHGPEFSRRLRAGPARGPSRAPSSGSARAVPWRPDDQLRPELAVLNASRCWKWAPIGIPLRAAIPKTVRKPTSEPSETPLPSAPAIAPPTSAMGNSRKLKSASRKPPNATWSRRKIATPAAIPKSSSGPPQR